MLPEECKIEGCGKKHSAKGLCRNHWFQDYRKTYKNSKTCSISGCGKPRDARGLCSTHYAQLPHRRLANSIYEKTSKMRERRKNYKMKIIPAIRSKIKSTIKYIADNEYREKLRNNTYAYRKTPKGKIYASHYQSIRRATYKDTDITQEFLENLWNNTQDCILCNRYLDQTRHLDHIIPLNIGGKHVKDNVRYLCAQCNCARPHDGHDISPLTLTQLVYASSNA